MTPRVRRRARIALLALLLSGAAAWLIPCHFSAEPYRHRLQAGLERTLHRQVTFGRVSVRVLPRPGFVIESAVIHEDPAFGSEPFARVERVECDVRWQTLLGARLDFSRIRLQHPNINLVRKAEGGWNVERLFLILTAADLRDGGLRYSGPKAADVKNEGGAYNGPTGLPDLEVEDGRVNFKLGADKKALAITDLRARLSFDAAHRYLQFRVVGSPVRTDLSLPTPGAVEASGEWTPGRDFRGPLNAMVRAREALMYDWAPLVTGRNTGLYGVLDAELRVTGPIRSLSFEGRSRLSELHRWDEIPPADPMPWTVAFRGQLDRDQGRVLLETMEASFADSHIHVSGALDYLPSSPEVDLVLALERSRLEDLTALAGRVWTWKGGFGIRGRVEGMLAIKGPWSEPRYGGFVGAHDVVLSTRSATFPVSEFAVRIDNRGAHLAPVHITLAPRVALEAEGSLDRGAKSFPYELTLSCKAAPLRDVLNFGRALGMSTLQGWDAMGSGTAAFRFTGSLGSPSRPALRGRAELRSARLVIPGFVEPINVPRASLQVNDDEITVDHLLAVFGTSVFSGRLEHQGDRHSPWIFDLQTNQLDLEQGASWFAAFAHRNPLPLFQRLPGLGSFAAQPEVASNLFSSVNARGRFSAAKITLRKIGLDGFRANVQVVGRVVRLSDAAFQTAGGRGRLMGRVDLTARPAHLAADVLLSGVKVQAIVPHLPPALRGAHGLLSVNGHFETTGLNEEEMLQNLEGRAAVAVGDLSLAGFDPVGAFVRLAGEGTLEPLRGPVGFRPVTMNLQVHDRRVVLKRTTLELSGARLSLYASQAFDGPLNLHVAADLQRLRRRWLSRIDVVDSDGSARELDFSGSLDKLAPTSVNQQSEVRRAVTSEQ